MFEQAPAKVIHLNRYYHFTELMRDPRVEGQLVRYPSDYDRTTQTALVLRPAGRKSRKLFFFFHGMDGDCGDAVVVRDLVSIHDATVVAMGGRGASWVSNAFLADAEQVITRHAEGFNGFYLLGVSMGGTQALSLAALMSARLRQSVLGLIALIPGASLQAILAYSSNDRVRNSIRESVHGDELALPERSPENLIDQYSSGLPFVIVYNEDDTLLLAQELRRFIASLREKGHPVATFARPGDHEFTHRNFDYGEVLRQMGNDAAFDVHPIRAEEE